MEFAAQVRDRVIPAVPVPFDESGEIDGELQDQYVTWMAGQAIGGVAVWAHTGRGMKLTDGQREAVLRAWRSGLPDTALVCGVGVPESRPLPADAAARKQAVLAAAASVADDAKRGGADALLAHPPKALADIPARDQAIVEYHETLVATGLPVIAFFLYEAAGGLSYAPELIRAILSLDGVVGIKVATLDSVMTYQDILAIVRARGETLAITGEDRFLGYSLAVGARSALIGMGAALTDVAAALLAARARGTWDEFIRLSSALDDFARATFVVPMEGYVQRMLWALEADGVMSRAASDPWCPPLEPGDRDRVFAAVRALRSS
ncbi:MAG: dihydrodipicolinate synthase family protein [Gemmatimonadetes bacterium]|nr:dihydrodipicolinate synthase family protein [Gemmatimonadota bacterium]